MIFTGITDTIMWIEPECEDEGFWWIDSLYEPAGFIDSAIVTISDGQDLYTFNFADKELNLNPSTNWLWDSVNVRQYKPNIQFTPQSETTSFRPRSPYAAAKLYAHWMTVNYREAFGLFAANGILFNHESPRRGETFVTRKITRAVARMCHGLQNKLFLGNFDAMRDWGHAKDYVEAMWLMLQQNIPQDFVIASGEQHSVREFVEAAAHEVDMSLTWKGHGQDEVGYDSEGNCIVRIDPRYFRPTEVDTLLGDASRAHQILGWSPTCCFNELVAEMMKNDLQQSEEEKFSKQHGFSKSKRYE